MEPIRRVTVSTVDVLKVMLGGSDPVWGLLIIKETQRPAGTIYPILERLERQSWITSEWEDDPARTGPRRRLYRFTAEGATAARAICASYEARNRDSAPASAGKLATS